MSGNIKASRAVGTANSSNPLPIIIPCHRVITSNGSIGGYTYGLKIKKKFLFKVEYLHKSGTDLNLKIIMHGESYENNSRNVSKP